MAYFSYLSIFFMRIILLQKSYFWSVFVYSNSNSVDFLVCVALGSDFLFFRLRINSIISFSLSNHLEACEETLELWFLAISVLICLDIAFPWLLMFVLNWIDWLVISPRTVRLLRLLLLYVLFERPLFIADCGAFKGSVWLKGDAIRWLLFYLFIL